MQRVIRAAVLVAGLVIVILTLFSTLSIRIVCAVPHWSVEMKGTEESYRHEQVSEPIAMIDIEYFIEIAMVGGNAAHKLGVKVGDEVEVNFSVK